MDAHRKAAQCFPFLLRPAGIVIGYLFSLFAVVAGAVKLKDGDHRRP
jgi:hypothetical protein